MSDRVNIVDFTGAVKSVPKEDVDKELARGGRLESAGEAGQRLVGDVREQEFGGAAGAGKAVLAGAARGLTFGLSDLVVTEGFGVDPGTLAGIRQENPGLSMGSEIAGAVVPGLFSGGTGALAGIAKAAPSGALVARTTALGARVGGLKGVAAATALEGAAFGAGQAVSNLALSNEPLTAEAALTEFGLNMAFGAGAGVAGGFIGVGLGKLADNVGERAAARFGAGEGAGTRTLDEALGRASQEAKAVTAGLQRTVDDALDTVARIGQGSNVRGTPSQLKKWAQERHELLTKEANELMQEARAMNLGEGKLARLQKSYFAATNMAESLLDPGLKMNLKTFSAHQQKLFRLEGALRDVAEKMDEAQGAAGSMFSKHAKLKEVIGSHDNVWHNITDSGQFDQRMGPRPGRVNKPDPELQSVVREVSELRKDFRQALGLKNSDVLNETTFRRLARMDKDSAIDAAVSWKNYHGGLRKLADKVPDPEMRVELQGQLEQMSRIFKEFAPGDLAGKSSSEVMTALGMLGLSEVAIPDLEGPADEVLKVWLAAKMMKNPGALTRGTPGNRGFGDRVRHVMAGYAGASAGSAFARNTGGGGMSSYVMRSQGAQIMRNMADAAVLGGNKLAQSTGKAVARIEDATAHLLKGASKATRRTAPAAAAVLSRVRFGGEEDESPKDLHGAFQARARELAAIQANPMAAHERVYNNLTAVRAAHPLIADKMEMQAMRAAQFLYEKMPKDPGVISSFGKSRWRPDEGAIVRWSNYVKAVDDPISVLEDAARGSINPQGAEVLRMLYPAMYFEAQKLLAQNAEKLQKNTTYDQRVRLSVLFAVPVDSSVDPNFTKWSQQFWTERMTNEKPMDGGQLNPEEPSEAQALLGR